MKNNLTFVLLMTLCAVFGLHTAQAQVVVVESKSKPSCNGECNGELTFKVEEAAAAPFFLTLKHKTRAFEKLATISNELKVKDLCPGEYELSIQSERFSYCAKKTINVSVSDVSLTLALISLTNPSGSSSKDGSIEVQGQSSRSNPGVYTYRWGNGNTGNRLQGLNPGTYSVTMRDEQLGCEVSQSFVLAPCTSTQTDFELVLTGGIMPSTGTQIARVGAMYRKLPDGKLEPLPAELTINWYVNGQKVASNGNFLTFTSADINSLVKAEVTNGCQVTKSATKVIVSCANPEALKDLFITKIDAPCVGFSNGSARFTLSLPPFGEETILNLVDGPFSRKIFTQSKQTSGPPYEFWVDGLRSEKEYRIKGFLGEGCPIDFAFTLPSHPTEKKFSKFKKGLCYYNEECKGVPYGMNETLKESPLFDVDKFNVDNFKCSGPLFCKDGNKVVQVDKKVRGWIHSRAIVWLNMLVHEFGFDLNDPSVRQLLGVEQALKNPCINFEYCKFNPLNVRFKSQVLERPVGKVVPHPSKPNCFTFRCSSILPLVNSRHTVCSPKLPEEFKSIDGKNFRFFTVGLSQEPISIRECQTVRRNLLEMISLHLSGALEQSFPGNGGWPNHYKGSKLELALAGFNISAVNDRKMRCAVIEYCKNDFRVAPVITFNNCGTDITTREGLNVKSCDIKSILVKADEFEYSFSDGYSQAQLENILVSKPWDYVEFYCKEGVYAYARAAANPRVFRESEGEGFGLSSFSENFASPEDSIQTNDTDIIISDQDQNEKLIDFNLMITQGLHHPRALIKNQSGYKVIDFEYGPGELRKIDAPGKMQFDVSWDESRDVFATEMLKDKEVKLEFADTLAGFESLLKGSFVQVKKLSGVDTSMFVSGLFTGALSLDSIGLGSVVEPSIFFLEISRSGTIQRFATIEGVDTTQKMAFSEFRGDTVIVASKVRGDLKINGMPFGLIQPNSIALFQLSKNSVTKMQELPAGNTSQVKAISLSPKSMQVSTIISGVDSIYGQGAAIVCPIGSKHAILNLSISGMFKWAQTFTSSNIDTIQMAVTQSEASETFVGLTFRDSLTLQGVKVRSAGMEDLLIAKFLSNGALQWIEKMGTTDYESISKLMYSYGVIAFGGQLKGSTTHRPMGLYNIVNNTTSYNRVYVSALIDSAYQMPTIDTSITDLPTLQSIEKSSKVDQNPLKSVAYVNVFPNPVRHELTIEFYSEVSSVWTVRLFDNLGAAVKEQKFETQKGYNAQMLQASSLRSGIYFLQVIDSYGRLVKTHKIVKID
jgi:Secretion system C-terminal sorting domain